MNIAIKSLMIFMLCLMADCASAQSAFTGSLADFSNSMTRPGADHGSTDVDGMVDADAENRSNRSEVRDAENDAGRGAVDMGTEMVDWGMGTAEAAGEFANAWEALSDTDTRCALFDPGPQIPSSCGESGSACYQCYERATGALNANRQNLHRAWCITHANLSMGKSAIGFGDSSSGVHGVVGLSWSLGGKPQIEQAMNDLRATYDRKQGQFIEAISGNLQALGRCEAEHFDERDWFNRFGYMYLDHLRVRYKSAEP